MLAGQTKPLLAVAVAASVAVAALPASADGTTSTLACQSHTYYSDEHLVTLVHRNCKLVGAAKEEFDSAIAEGRDHTAAQGQVWHSRSVSASDACVQAGYLLWPPLTRDSIEKASLLALNAWGMAMMDGRECCNLLEPPYCVDQEPSVALAAGVSPFVILIVLFCMSILAASCLTKKKEEKPFPSEESMLPKEETSTLTAVGVEELEADLKQRFERSPIRVLPHAAAVRDGAASLFSKLCAAYGFQEDNAKNQFEHLLSLLRSQCAMVADRDAGEEQLMDKSAIVDESMLLGTAIGDLHAELLDGFQAWRRSLCACDPAGMRERGLSEMPKLAGIEWRALDPEVRDSTPEDTMCGPADNGQRLSVQLAEIAMFLFVWGEAGNVRFMPEVLYFITELALAAESVAASGVAGMAAEHTSGFFLARIIRPIYSVVFEEWYSKVEGKGSAKDSKKLWPQLQDFLSANVGNYDDWNELFCDPQRLVSTIECYNGTKFFALSHQDRFSALPELDWKISLLAEVTKTHREVHSLWGVFATAHRVILMHTLLFTVALCLVTGDPPEPLDGALLLLGRAAGVRFCAVGLIVPAHAVLWWLARWQITGPALRTEWLDILKGVWVKDWWRRLQETEPTCCARFLFILCHPAEVVMLLPTVTYGLVRVMDQGGLTLSSTMWGAVAVHLLVSLFGLVHLLFVPSDEFKKWKLTPVRKRDRAIRYFFWLLVFGVKFLLSMGILAAIDEAMDNLGIARPGHQTIRGLTEVYYTTNWCSNVLIWAMMWGIAFILFTSDTQLWFTLACTVLGAVRVLKQRKFRADEFILEDAMANIPERFSKKILPYTMKGWKGADNNRNKDRARFSHIFPAIWDRVIEYMRYEDDIDSYAMCKLVFDVKSARDKCVWEDLSKPLKKPSGEQHIKVKLPDIFRHKNSSETCFKTYCCWPGSELPQNHDIQWRLAALGRGLGLPMPRPYRAPYFPGLTVLIPHYGEQILIQKGELFQEDRTTVVPLMHWLKQKYEDEFLNFANRMRAREITWPIAGDEWEEYTPQQWERVTSWAAMRLQTLWRTVAGLCYYHPALQCHWEMQNDENSSLGKEGIWNPSDCFTCLVSMQMYKFFNQTQLEHTNRMFDKFPSCFKVAFIDCQDKGEHAHADGVHRNQERRYYSCLIDRTCKVSDSEPYTPLFRIELPGFPILGDGKGDNQNHAIPFMRGHFSQCIDANQGAYFEQMMMLPCALGEFRQKSRGDGLAKRIVGFPEHITSDIGSIGDFAASAEVAFGTILQRTYAVLGARMHYGHPDIMNKLFMMQQGGVSKATKTLNLSEDIFAGMDFTLRGGGRQIKHCEYFHLAKGRDMGFNAVLGFFSKLSSGTGEQVLSRQTFRLSNVLELPEALSFYYAHAGYYFNQFFVSWSMPLLLLIWLLVLLSDCEDTFQAFQHCQADRIPAPQVMSGFLSACFSWLLVLFLIANTMPLFMELWMERSLKDALSKVFTSLLTLSPLMFIFQAKTIGFYITNEFRYGGASYVATGRGLPTERLAVIAPPKKGEEAKGYSGLFLDYINIAFYDGVLLLFASLAVVVAGGLNLPHSDIVKLRWTWASVWLVITSWLFAPFLFNPYNFRAKYFFEDLRALRDFFFANRGKNWDAWYDKTVLKKVGGLSRSMDDIGFFLSILFLSAWYFTLNLKAEAVITIYSEYSYYDKATHMAILLPPMFCSLIYCACVVLIESCAGLATASREGLERLKRRARRRSIDRKVAARQKARERLGKSSTLEAEEALGEVPDELEAAEEPPVHTQPRWEGLPLALSAVMVVVLDIVEAVALLYPFFMWVTWRKALIAGLILKWGLLSMCVYLGENMIPGCLTGMSLPLELWVRAHRMARDMLVSIIVVLPQLPVVFLVTVNEGICPGCSLHQLLIYRDPGTVDRQERVFELDEESAVIIPPTHTVAATSSDGSLPSSASAVSPPEASPSAPLATTEPTIGQRLGGWFGFACAAPPPQATMVSIEPPPADHH